MAESDAIDAIFTHQKTNGLRFSGGRIIPLRMRAVAQPNIVKFEANSILNLAEDHNPKPEEHQWVKFTPQYKPRFVALAVIGRVVARLALCHYTALPNLLTFINLQ